MSGATPAPAPAPAARDAESILDEMARRSRGLRPYLILSLAVVIGSLIASVVWLNQLKIEATTERDLAIAERDKALAEAKRVKILENTIEEAKNKPKSESVAILDKGLEKADAVQRPAQAQKPLSALSLTIFVCSDASPKVAALAPRVRGLRPADSKASWTVDTLSAQQNARWNYQLKRNEIRFNPEETDAAEALVAQLRGATGIEVARVLTYYPTPGAMSLFLCDGARPAPPAAS